MRTAVAANGVVLGGSAATSSSLPQVADDATPAVGERVRNPLVLDALAVLGAAPTPLDRLAARVYEGSHGLTVQMRNGLQVYFGDATRPHAKWLSLARVLADRSSQGAIYVDVRLPERPAAGFAEDGSPTGAEASAPGSREGGESTVSSLAAGLSADSPEPKSAGGEAGTQAGTEPGSQASGEAASQPSGEGASQPSGEAQDQSAGGGEHPEATTSSGQPTVPEGAG